MSFTFKGLTPSTPNRSKRSLFAQQQSTTPKIPPPSHLSHPSTTPLGPPPRSIFGSSTNAASRGTFGIKGNVTRGFHVPNSSPPISDDEDADGDEEEEGGDHHERGRHGKLSENSYYEGHDAPMDMGMVSPGKDAFMSSIMTSPRGLKRSRNGKPREQSQSDMAAVARGYLRQKAPSTTLSAPDEMIIEQEERLAALDDRAQKSSNDLDDSLANGCSSVGGLWQEFTDTSTKEGELGPAVNNGSVEAAYIGSLLLQLHHPHAAPAKPFSGQFSSALVKSSVSTTAPRALLDWLEIYHKPFPDDFETIYRHRPSPADHERFWDTVYASIARGKFSQAIRLLRDAGWDHAITAIDDLPQTQPEGYSGRQLENIETAVAWCVQVLSSCPALTDQDWDVKNADWTIFRQRVRQTLKHLESFAGTEDDDEEEPLAEQGNVFQRSSRLGGDKFSISAASKRAESKVPWSVYENLKLVYGLLIGGVDELLDTSQDWLEGSLYLTIWWDGEDENAADMRRSSGPGQKPREVDLTPLVAYRKRLADAFDLVSTDDQLDAVFQVNTLDPVQVALACIMEDDVNSVIGLLRMWSPTVSSAVVEIAALGGWLPQGRPRSAGLLQQGFNSEDLMVLSHGPGQQPVTAGEVDRDEVLRAYAELLGKKSMLTGKDGKVQKEGWELAVSVLGRLDDTSAAQNIIGDLLGDIELNNEERVNRVLSACADLDLVEQARSIAERYADSLTSSHDSYGIALTYYARARAAEKLKNTLALLTTTCLIQSAAIPGQAALEETLISLLTKERTGLINLASIDGEAAALLSSHISGYATVRRFYDLRDQDHNSSLERKREAAKALIAVTESAADCIRGGLFDPSVESIIPVDGLLVLLGEALPLLGQNKRVFTRDQVFTLLRVVEDISTAPSRIRDDAETLLHAAITAYHQPSSKTASKRQGKKDGSGVLSGSASSYDMLASASLILNDSQAQNGNKADGSRESNVQRAWDWRKGLDGVPGGVEVGAHEVLLLLRTALAQEVARGWSGIIRW